MGREDDTTPERADPSLEGPGRRDGGGRRMRAETLRTGSEPPPGAPAPASAAPSSEIDSEVSSEAESRHRLGVTDVEALLARGEYRAVCDLLGPVDRAGELSPALALLYIAARAELGEGAALADLPHLAMQTSGRLLELPASATGSRLVAKRLLGLSPLAIQRRMPSAQLGVGLVVLGVCVGLAVGWLIGRGGL